jgi:phage/plasmid-associated DNA primase
LDPPETVRAATSAYKAESDPVGLFILERCVIGPDQRVGAGELYKAYHSWAQDSGLKDWERLNSTKFGRVMGERFEKKQQSKGNVYLGIGLLTDREGATNRAEMEGSIRTDPPFSSFSPTQSLTREEWKNRPQPSIPPSKETTRSADVASQDRLWPSG